MSTTTEHRERAIDRDEAIQRIRKALKERSGKLWSVTGGTGTAWGWIRITAAPARCTWGHRLNPNAKTEAEEWEAYDTGEKGRNMSPADCKELGELMGLEHPAHHQGISIAASTDYRVEHVDRAEGRPPSVIGQPYWD